MQSIAVAVGRDAGANRCHIIWKTSKKKKNVLYVFNLHSLSQQLKKDAQGSNNPRR